MTLTLPVPGEDAVEDEQTHQHRFRHHLTNDAHAALRLAAHQPCGPERSVALRRYLSFVMMNNIWNSELRNLIHAVGSLRLSSIIVISLLLDALEPLRIPTFK